MGWFKVDDQLAFHAKTVMVGNSAMGLWVRAGSWSSAHLTDGFIPAHMANAMANAMAKPSDTESLVESGLWDEVDGGYQFHDWSEFQPSGEEEKQKRKATSEARSAAGKAGAKARWDSKTDGKRNGKPMANASERDGKPMAPTRPVLKDKDSSSEVAKATPRPEVESLLDLLDKCIESNGLKTPSRNKGNTNSMRLLIDRDGYTPDQVAWIIRWATTDSFWRTNILSAVKLRDKFTQLMAKADVGQAPKAKAAGFNGEINVDAVLGKDYWQPPLPPEGMGVAEEIEWKKQRRADRKAERLEEARRKVETDNAAQI